MGDNQLKVISLNVCHSINLVGLVDILKNEKPTLCLLQEIPHTSSQLCNIVKNIGYLGYTSLMDDDKPGVGIIYKSDLVIENIYPLEPGRILSFKFNDLLFYNIYAPSGSNKKPERRIFFGETIFRNIQHRDFLPILVGDYNCIIDKDDTERNYSNKKCDALKDLVNLYSYVDAFRHFNANLREYTYHKGGASASRLDRVYIPPNLLNLLTNCEHQAGLYDHKMLKFTLDIDINPLPTHRNFSYWKLNTQILNHPDFLDNFRKTWDILYTKVNNYTSVDLWWENFAKPQIKEFLIRFSKMRRYSRKGTKRFLFIALDMALNDGDFIKANSIKVKLKKMIMEDNQAIIIRSRLRESAEEERGSLYHAARELKRGEESSLEQMMVGGNPTNDKAEIETEVLSFFSSLYNGFHRTNPQGGEPVNTGQPFIPDLDLLDRFTEGVGRLSEDEAEGLHQPITLSEFKDALDLCAKNRSPGIDGLPYEFYRKVFNIIGPTFVNILNTELNQERLGESQRRGVTRLIPKVNGIPNVNELRPISLLCTDYKLLSKILARRLTNVLPSVLKSKQLCGKKDRNILFGATNLISTIDYINSMHLNGYIASFDIFKAFDRTSMPYILRVMEKMNFPAQFINWIKIMHTDVSTQFLLAELSEPVKLLNCLRQGDNFAMPIFLINIEPLFLEIEKATKGIQIGIIEEKDEPFVDDCSVVSSELSDLTKINLIFNDFEKISGTILHRTKKCKIMGIGRWAGREEWPLPFLETCKQIKIFGIQFCPTVNQTIKKSWQDCVENIKKCILTWSNRMLPNLSQRAFLLKVFALSKIWYLAQVLPMPNNILREIEQKIQSFLWLGRLERLSLEELHVPLSEGGLGIPNILAKADSLFTRHLLRILENETPTRDHLMYWVGERMRDTFPNIRLRECSRVITPYFENVIEKLSEDSIEPKISENPVGYSTKSIYKMLNSTPAPPKVTQNYDREWSLVWANLDSPFLEADACNLLFIIIHNIFPNKQRLNRLNNMHPTGFCPRCQYVTEDNIHFFCECIKVADCFNYIKQKLVENGIFGVMDIFVPNAYMTRIINDKILHLEWNFVNISFKHGFLFLISNYVQFIYKCHRNDINPNIELLRSQLVASKPQGLHIEV